MDDDRNVIQLPCLLLIAFILGVLEPKVQPQIPICPQNKRMKRMQRWRVETNKVADQEETEGKKSLQLSIDHSCHCLGLVRVYYNCISVCDSIFLVKCEGSHSLSVKSQ